MKHILGIILAMLAANAVAQTTTPTADSWEVRQRNEANNGIYIYYIVPDGAVDQIPTYNGNTNKPEYSKLGTGLSRTGTTLNVSLSASQITGTTATGQALMTATDAAAARTAIGASPVITRSFAHQTRDLNTCYQISSTRDALVSYAVEVTAVSTLSAGQLGTVFLETFTDSGCTTGTQEIMRGISGLSQGLGLTVTLTNSGTVTLHGVVAAGLYVKQRTENTTGTPSFAARPGQEVQL